MEIQENISPNISEEPKVDAPKTVEKLEAPKHRNSGFVVAILLFLVIALMGGLAYYVLKDNGVNLLSGIIKTEVTNNSDTTCQSDSTTTEKTCDLTVTNSGWALFSLPEYKFSFEMPNYWPKITLGGEQVSYIWTYKPYKTTDTGVTGLLSDYLYSVDISFEPSEIPASVACGGFCVKQHEMNVNIYANSDHKTLAQISTLYFANWNKLNGNEMTNIEDLGSSNKWSREVSTYKQNYVESAYNGYIVTTNDYIYEISYHISSDPAESQTAGQKVLDSMKFGQ